MGWVKYFFLVGFGCGISICGISTWAVSDLTKIELLSKIASKYGNFNSFSSDLEKTTVLKALALKKTYSGKLNFSKDKIRLDIKTPSKSIVLFDNKQITTVQYPEDAEFDDTIRVMKTKTNNFLNQMLQGDFTKLKVLSVATKGDIVTYELVPKKPIGLTKASVSIDSKKILVTQFSYWDTLENKTSFIFSNVVTGRKIEDNLFELKIPKNAITTEL